MPRRPDVTPVMVEVTTDVIASVVYAFNNWRDSPDKVSDAYALQSLNDSMSDLASWHPDYDYETGLIRERGVNGELVDEP